MNVESNHNANKMKIQSQAVYSESVMGEANHYCNSLSCLKKGIEIMSQDHDSIKTTVGSRTYIRIQFSQASIVTGIQKKNKQL